MSVWVGVIDRTPVADVRVCGSDATKCTTTDSDGKATLELPADEETIWTLTKEGYGSVLVADVTDDTFASTIGVPVATDYWLLVRSGWLNTPSPMTGVLIWTEPESEGVTFELLVGEGKVFYGNERASLEPEATTDEGSGGFVELEQGEVLIKIGGTGERCVIGLGWPGEGQNTIRLPVQQDHVTYATLICDRPQDSEPGIY